LNDLFEEDLKVPKPKSSIIMEDFTETPTLKVNGSIGTKIAKELNLNLSGSDTMTMTIKLGDIVKNECDWESLQEALEKQRIKTNHPLLKETKKSKRSTLCVVLESLVTKGEGELSKDTDIEVKTDDTGDMESKKVSIISVDVTGKGDVERKHTNSFKIPPATVLAYSCNEFSIDSSGMATLHSAVDVNDTSGDPLFTLNGGDSDPVDAVRVEFQPLVKCDKFERIRIELKMLLEKNPDNDLIGSMHLLLAAAEFKIENKSEEKTLSTSTLTKLFQEGEDAQFNAILQHLGFALPETWDEGSVITFPDAQYELIKSVISLLDALMDIEANVRTLLGNLSQTDTKSILNIVLNEIQGKENSMDDRGPIKKFFTATPSAQLLLKEAGFVEMKIDDEDLLCFTKSKLFHLMDLYSVLYVFSH